MLAAAFHESMHLKESQLAPADPACPFCHSTDRIPVWLLQENPQVLLLTCRACYSTSASRVPNSDTLTKYYQTYYRGELQSSHERKVTFDVIHKLADHIYRHIQQYRVRDCISILDFGGGDGSIAIRIAERYVKDGCGKVNITLVDFNEKVAPFDDRRISLTREATLWDLQNERYDLVIASAIIEHLPQPQEHLNRLLYLVRPGGIFYARTPYMMPVLKLLATFGVRLDFAYPGHIHDIGPEFWNIFFSKLCPDMSFEILVSKPSIVETSFKDHFLRTLAAYILKAPGYLLGERYKMVGGWEIFVKSRPDTQVLVGQN